VYTAPNNHTKRTAYNKRKRKPKNERHKAKTNKTKNTPLYANKHK